MRRPRKLSRRGTKFIASFEGFVPRPYKDAVGVLTQGFGHTGSGITQRPWSRSKGLRVLRKDAQPVAEALQRAIPRKLRLRQHQFDALVSIGFNVGPGVYALGRSLGNALRSGNKRDIADSLLLYDHAGGQRLEGLTRRRIAERRIFLSGYRR